MQLPEVNHFELMERWTDAAHPLVRAILEQTGVKRS
jgi:hypothetical protein